MLFRSVYFWNFAQIFKNLKRNIRYFSKYYIKTSLEKPIAVLLEFLRFLKASTPLFAKLKTSALVLQTLDDDTVKPSSANYIYGSITGEKALKFYENGGHLVFHSESSAAVCCDILNYLEGIKP